MESWAICAKYCLLPAKTKLCNFTQQTKTIQKQHCKTERSPFPYTDDNNQLNWNQFCFLFTWESLHFSCFHHGDQIKRLRHHDKIVYLDMHMVVLPVKPWQIRSIALREKGQWRCRRQLCSSNYDQAETQEAPAFLMQAEWTEESGTEWHPV